jgi:hypothetical protein
MELIDLERISTQKGASFNLEDVKAMVETAMAGHAGT